MALKLEWHSNNTSPRARRGARRASWRLPIGQAAKVMLPSVHGRTPNSRQATSKEILHSLEWLPIMGGKSSYLHHLRSVY